jgi:hypothetical protein
MTHPKRPSVQVVSEGRRRFIAVPADSSHGLRLYLRAHHVRCEHPEPCYSGVDQIELAKDTDAARFQVLLDKWV